jgi:bifunctional DNA-binding transcriptional regulator/antitoxin component of YhaV-PrlF toxin-antitoxin module
MNMEILAKIWKAGYDTSAITIPKDVRNHLGLKYGDIIKVLIIIPEQTQHLTSVPQSPSVSELSDVDDGLETNASDNATPESGVSSGEDAGQASDAYMGQDVEGNYQYPEEVYDEDKRCISDEYNDEPNNDDIKKSRFGNVNVK